MAHASAKLLTAAAFAVLLAVPSAAQATNKVSSPDVTKGQVELEYRGGYDSDERAARDRQHSHKFVANHGITDRWRTEVKGVYAGRSGNLDWTYVEWSNRFQVFKDKESWLKLAVQQNYKFALHNNLADKLEFTVLAAKDTGPLTHVANFNFENELGRNATGGTDINMGWKTKYRHSPSFEPGVEAYADFGKIGSAQANFVDRYQLGPVASGKITDTVKYDVGLLFGLSHSVPDARLKWLLTHAF